jgi:hypothetical protein
LSTLIIFDHGRSPHLLSLHLFILEGIKLVLKLLDLLVPGGLGSTPIVEGLLREVQIDRLQIPELILRLRLLVVHSE